MGGSPNVTGGCEKMGNWRSRSGQAILRECRAVGKNPSRVPNGLPGHLDSLRLQSAGMVRAPVLTVYTSILVA